MPYCTRCGKALAPAEASCGACGHSTARSAGAPLEPAGISGSPLAVLGLLLLVGAVAAIVAGHSEIQRRQDLWMDGISLGTAVRFVAEAVRWAGMASAAVGLALLADALDGRT